MILYFCGEIRNKTGNPDTIPSPIWIETDINHLIVKKNYD